jgi:flagellar capping protein FliD
MKWQKINGNGIASDIDIASSSGKYAGSTVSSANPRLVINNAIYNDGAIYRLVVTNAGGETTSNLIEIRVVGKYFFQSLKSEYSVLVLIFWNVFFNSSELKAQVSFFDNTLFVCLCVMHLHS